MMNAEQHREFTETGLLHLPGAIAMIDARAMCDRLWDALATERQIRRDEPETWIRGRLSKFHTLEKSGAYADMGSPAVCDALDDLFGRDKWQRPPRWGSLLADFPYGEQKWDVPNKVWHVDGNARRLEAEIAGVIVFAFLDTVSPAGGGTVVISGSHRLVGQLAAMRGASLDPLRSEEISRILSRSHPWLRDLWSHDGTIDRAKRFMREGAMINRVPLRVVELTGSPGDVIVMHLGVVHAPVRNSNLTPRLMLRQGINRRSEGQGAG